MYAVVQISKSRWIVTKDGVKVSKHASLADAQRAVKNYETKELVEMKFPTFDCEDDALTFKALKGF